MENSNQTLFWVLNDIRKSSIELDSDTKMIRSFTKRRRYSLNLNFFCKIDEILDMINQSW